MVRTQIYLTEAQGRGLKALAAQTGKSQSELIRTAVDEFLAKPAEDDWKEGLLALAGSWADRDDLDGHVEKLRREWDDRLKRLWDES